MLGLYQHINKVIGGVACYALISMSSLMVRWLPPVKKPRMCECVVVVYLFVCQGGPAFAQ